MHYLSMSETARKEHHPSWYADTDAKRGFFKKSKLRRYVGPDFPQYPPSIVHMAPAFKPSNDENPALVDSPILQAIPVSFRKHDGNSGAVSPFDDGSG
jgi:hypothetical protein